MVSILSKQATPVPSGLKENSSCFMYTCLILSVILQISNFFVNHFGFPVDKQQTWHKGYFLSATRKAAFCCPPLFFLNKVLLQSAVTFYHFKQLYIYLTVHVLINHPHGLHPLKWIIFSAFRKLRPQGYQCVLIGHYRRQTQSFTEWLLPCR